jgi:RND family efflux transporter MFP subunit
VVSSRFIQRFKYLYMSRTRTLLNSRVLAMIGVLVLISALVLGRSFFNGETEVTETAPRSVTLASVAELSDESSARTIVGTVRAESEALLETQRGGQVTRVLVQEGAFVRAGTLLAEVENRIERAAVAQATAGRDAQRAALARVERGTRDEQVRQLETGLAAARREDQEARVAAQNALAQSYTLAEDAIRNKVDTLFDNPRNANARLFVITGQYSERQQLQRERYELEQLLQGWENERGETAPGNLEQRIRELEQRFERIRTFLDALARLVSAQTPDSFTPAAEIEAQKGALLAARSNVNSGLSALSAARSRLSQARSGIEQAQAGLDQGIAGALPEEIDQARAAVAQASASVEAAVAQLEQTRVRAPISGTLASFTLSRGDIATPGMRIGSITSDGRPFIEAFIAEQDRTVFAEGDEVSIEGGGTGVIASIAPGLDQVTRRVRVQIDVTESPRELTSGATVRITLQATRSDASDTDTFTIPINAVKFGAGERFVYRVDDDERLVEVPVTLGAVSGSRVEITDGIDADTLIVTDARGLRAGQEVTIAN